MVIAQEPSQGFARLEDAQDSSTSRYNTCARILIQNHGFFGCHVVVRKTPAFEPFCTKKDGFAKTGIGTNIGQIEQEGVLCKNHRWEHTVKPLWPKTYASMPTAVQALMLGLLAAQRSEVFESAFDEDGKLNRARFERRRSAAMAEMEAERQTESKL